MTPVETLLATAERIRKLQGTIAAAVHIPAQRRSMAARVNVSPFSYGEHADILAAAKTIQGRLGDEMEAEGIAQRDTIIAAAAAELESLRADLCNQAAAAAVELGAIARNLKWKATPR